MKKIKIISFLILLSSQLFSQNSLDTICHSFAGKIHFEFDYYENKIINKDVSVFLEDVEVYISKNEFLVVDLYDNCECVKTQNFIKERKIIVYFRDGEIKTYKNNSEDTVLHFDGTEIKKVIINKPKLKEDNPHDIRKS
jgi:hypothetical protein